MTEVISATKSKIGAFEKNLTWWVLGCIVVGIAFGEAFPNFFQAIGGLKVAEVNLPVALLIWLMIIPMPAFILVIWYKCDEVALAKCSYLVRTKYNWISPEAICI